MPVEKNIDPKIIMTFILIGIGFIFHGHGALCEVLKENCEKCASSNIAIPSSTMFKKMLKIANFSFADFVDYEMHQ